MNELLEQHGERACELVVSNIMPQGKLSDEEFKMWVEGWLLSHDLLTSLDAWRPLWELMTPVQRANHSMALGGIKTGSLYKWDSEPHHHLEAALRAIEDACPNCAPWGSKGKRGVRLLAGIATQQSDAYTDCTCNNGKRTLYDIWEREINTKPHA